MEDKIKDCSVTIDELAVAITQETTQKTTQEKILELIKKNPSITQTQMANALGINRDGVSYNIKQLKDNGVIERVGATKNGRWIIK